VNVPVVVIRASGRTAIDPEPLNDRCAVKQVSARAHWLVAAPGTPAYLANGPSFSAIMPW
jgi:hypothetical protein